MKYKYGIAHIDKHHNDGIMELWVTDEHWNPDYPDKTIRFNTAEKLYEFTDENCDDWNFGSPI